MMHTLRHKVRFVSLAFLLVGLSLTARADWLEVAGFATDGSDGGGPKFELWAYTTHQSSLDQFEQVFPFIDGHPIQDENDVWQSMELEYVMPQYHESFHMIVPTTAGWHYVNYLGHTIDDQYEWDPSTDWICIAC